VGKKGKSDAQAYLEQVEKLDAVIRNKLIEKQQWKEIAVGITANMDGERVQSSGAKSKMADAIAKCVDIDAEIDSLIDNLIDLKKEVTQTIEKLQSPTEYNLLHMRYIQFIPLKDIAERWHTEYTNVTTAHGKALKKVQELMNKK
jgi:DNA-directed RNA polymerase specialized sigma subunit